MPLAAGKCVPCTAGTQALSRQEAEAFTRELVGWHISDDGKWLIKSLKFKNFLEAIAFTNKVGEIAEAEQHHPDIRLGWGYVEIHLQTHAASGLHENDFIMAAKIDQIQGYN